MSATETPPPLFYRRIPIAQHLNDEKKQQLDRMFDSYHNGNSHFHQVMILAAGIAGVVVPLLYAQGKTLANPWFCGELLSVVASASAPGLCAWLLVGG